MVDAKIIQEQLRKINFGASPFNQAELRELPKIIHEDEVISECVNGLYEGGVALLVATEMRVLLIDKKPLRYLTVEDLRFDMINEIDFSHRLMSASITISTGSKTLTFKSYNQHRLRNLINLVQEHMSNGKKGQAAAVETQKQHLEEINKQLQMYLMAQHQQLQMQMQMNAPNVAPIELPKPDPQLADYLFAQRLLEQVPRVKSAEPTAASASNQVPDLTEEARREVFGRAFGVESAPAANHTDPTQPFTGIEISPIKVAYSKLPMMLRNRKFGRPSLHAHSKEQALPTGRQAAIPSTY